MAIEPKTPRKRAAKKASSKKSDAVENSDASETKSATKKKSASIPVPMFQSAPEAAKSAKAVKKVVPEVSADEPGDDDSRTG
ncbi:MAG: ribonuclease E/G, partial [Actinobacteria bacterium]|nr:ribonuclease E/G [Actinomycetota bacterium]